MKKIHYILIVALLALFSCTKEQTLSPTSSLETVDRSEFKTPVVPTNPNIVVTDVNDDKGNDITDPEKENQERTNKNAKN